jgi:glucose-6-phosphate isomerase
MMNIDFKNAGLKKPSSKQLEKFLAGVQTRGQGFYKIVDDVGVVENILKFAKQNKNKYSDVVVLGIGGSALGMQCLQQSLRHLYHNQLKNKKIPNLYVLDNVDPVLIKETEEVLNLKKTLFIVVTKSGGTPETLSQFFYFRKKVPAKQFVFVTDGSHGFLRKLARTQKYQAFSIPANVGGRFSVLTAVGLLPAALLGIDIKKLVAGARAMRDAFLSSNISQNLPFQLASVQHHMAVSGKNIYVLMPYSQKLIRFADWYRQLLAESLGKAKNRAGKTVHVGLTPVNALGVTDQHSQLQLYNEGPHDKFFMFVRVKNTGAKISIPNLFPQEESLHFLKNTSFNELLDVEYQGTALALKKNNRPNITITIDHVDEKSLGELFMLFEGATAFLGEFFGIDAYDQPGVELSKQITKQILLRKK